MTTTNNEIGERLAVATNDIKTMKDDIKEIKDLLKAQDTKFASFVDASEKRFVTRAELKISQWVFGFVISALALFLSLKDHLK